MKWIFLLAMLLHTTNASYISLGTAVNEIKHEYVKQTAPQRFTGYASGERSTKLDANGAELNLNIKSKNMNSAGTTKRQYIVQFTKPASRKHADSNEAEKTPNPVAFDSISEGSVQIRRIHMVNK